jgi:hypothetical protein
LQSICRKAESTFKKSQQLPPHADSEPSITPKKPQQKSLRERVTESKRVAELFHLMNQTNWNKFDDRYYIVNKRWFDRWKDFVAYDYIVKTLVE